MAGIPDCGESDSESPAPDRPATKGGMTLLLPYGSAAPQSFQSFPSLFEEVVDFLHQFEKLRGIFFDHCLLAELKPAFPVDHDAPRGAHQGSLS